MWAEGSTVLDRVRLKRTRMEAGVARLRLSHALSTTRMRPSAMPPSAILVVHRMADPLPGRLASDFAAGALAAPDWERAAEQRLGALYSSAARPAHGPVPPTAGAVVFADFAELMACLALDLIRDAASAWWWTAVPAAHVPRRPGAWFDTWAENPLHIPAALEFLAARGQALAVLRTITPAQSAALWRTLARAIGAPELTDPPALSLAANDAARHADSASKDDDEPGSAGRPSAATATSPQPGREPPPWEPYVPHYLVPPEAGAERRALLGLAMLMRRAPRIVFTPRFAGRWRRWIHQPESPDAPRSPARAAVKARSSASRVPFPREDSAAAAAPGAAPWMEEIPPRHEAVRSEPQLSVSGAPAVPGPHGDGEPEPAAWQMAVDALEAGVSTRFGGILYLIHFLRQSGTLRHFDTGLSAWATLDLLARCLLAPVWREVQDDAIWSALAVLDDRDPRFPPGAGFQSEPVYTAPAAWLRDLGPATLMARWRGARTELWRPEGFPISDGAAIEDPRSFPALPRRFRRNASLRCGGAPLSRGLRRFLRFLLPYARWRLAGALRGVPITDALRRRGTLSITRTHVDLIMPMRQISVPVRMAGLDANPGWVPEFGRVVTFHFEEG